MATINKSWGVNLVGYYSDKAPLGNVVPERSTTAYPISARLAVSCPWSTLEEYRENVLHHGLSGDLQGRQWWMLRDYYLYFQAKARNPWIRRKIRHPWNAGQRHQTLFSYRILPHSLHSVLEPRRTTQASCEDEQTLGFMSEDAQKTALSTQAGKVYQFAPHSERDHEKMKAFTVHYRENSQYFITINAI